MQPGDVVRLKSGGHKMTVERKIDQGQWYCVWWVAKEEKYEGRGFYEATLEPAN